MEENPPLDLIPVEDRPAPPLRRVHLVVAVPGELDGRLAIPLCLLIVDLALHVPELELSGPVPVELEEPLDLFVHEVLVPGFHPGDPPATDQPSSPLTPLLPGGATLRQGSRRRLSTPGEASNDAVPLLEIVVGVVEFPADVAADDEVVARQQPVVDNPTLERQQDRLAQEREFLVDHLLERVAQRHDAVGESRLLCREEDRVLLQEPKDEELARHEIVPRPHDAKFVRVELVRVLLDEGVDEVEVLDQCVPDLESMVWREGDDLLRRSGGRLDDLEPLVDEERQRLVELEEPLAVVRVKDHEVVLIASTACSCRPPPYSAYRSSNSSILSKMSLRISSTRSLLAWLASPATCPTRSSRSLTVSITSSPGGVDLIASSTSLCKKTSPVRSSLRSVRVSSSPTFSPRLMRFCQVMC